MSNKLQLTSHERRATSDEFSVGSALILAVVLTSLLAIIGVMFVMMARVDKMATSAISENKELNFAVETVVAKISQELVLDVPGMPKGAEYYDYPDANNAWLASLEPYQSKTDPNKYYWRQISDVYNRFGPVELGLKATIIPDNQKPSDVGDSNRISGYPADADGDGVADSNWVIIPDMTSSKGKPIYAAIRIVDNGGMLNVNTAYKFDPNATGVTAVDIDGSSQMQINLFALAQRGTSNTIEQLDVARYGNEPHDLNDYIRDVVWQYNEPNGRYTPFDISDELELRNRFLLEFEHIDTRIEKEVWTSAFTGKDYLHVPVDSGGQKLTEWFYRTQHDVVGPNDIYSYRHISTIYNMDRIIDPNSRKMVNINDANVSSLYSAIRAGLYDADHNFVDVNNVAAQLAVNIIDYRDSDSDVTPFVPDVNGITYYGFERPCIYISELAHRFKKDAVDPNIVYRSYAVELYKPYSGDNDPCNWRLVIDGNPISIDWSLGSRLFNVIRFEDPCTPAPLKPLLVVSFNDPNDPPDPNHSRLPYDAPYSAHFNAGSVISLTRRVGSVDIVVDSIIVPGPNDGWWAIDGSAHSIQRDIQLHKCIRRLWDSDVKSPTLGRSNAYSVGDSIYIQAHPANEDFTNIGEIGMLFRKGAYGTNGIGYNTDNDEEEEVRLDLTDPNFQQLFKYLTVFDPTTDGIDNNGDGYGAGANVDSNELKIPGRININTAPWYVIEQLPWVSDKIAQAIVAYRDKLDLSSAGGPDYYHSGASNSRRQETGLNNLREAPGFASIGELTTVINKSGKSDYDMRYYTLGAASGKDLTTFPDLTPSDDAVNDFEERDVIFARISNLVTVRSDVFTAYILVRIGADGPQKRAIAILDRSNVYPPAGGKVRIIALHPVPDPRPY